MEVVYDLETYPNAFTATFCPTDPEDNRMTVFEISDRRRDNQPLFNYVQQCTLMVGFNNLHFDWPILYDFLINPDCDACHLYALCEMIIGSNDGTHTIWNPVIPQIDLFRIHHFDNPAKSTSLKKLEFNMKASRVQDMPFRTGSFLDFNEIDVLRDYNCNDVYNTKKFYFLSRDKIAFRESINPKWMNSSDTGLGRKFFERELEAAGVALYEKDASGKRVPRGTPRPDGVKLADVIFSYIHFRTPILQKALDDFKACTITEVVKEDSAKIKRVGAPEDYSFELGGITIHMGLGGIHGSMERKHVKDCDIKDFDVTGYYPSLSIVNRLHPAHLGPAFCEVFAKLKAERAKISKKEPRSKAIKDGSNSVFGSSGCSFLPFYDPAYMLATTLNGQFLLLTLAELLLTIPDLELIQVNTDGLTVIIPPGEGARVEALAAAWSKATKLDLEGVTYKELFIRDVNNYVAVLPDGKRKLKGAYEPERQWHQNHSMPIVRRAALAAMLDGADVADFISANDSDSWGFMLRLDLGKEARLVLDDKREFKGVTRYYVSPTGNTGVKRMKATKTRIHGKGYAERTGSRGKWECSICGQAFKTVKLWEDHADVEHSSRLVIAQVHDGSPIDYDLRFYASEARKLIISDVHQPKWRKDNA